MKNLDRFLIKLMALLTVLLVTSSLIFWSCQDKIIETYRVNNPVYLAWDDLRKSVACEGSTEIKIPGKIYFKDGYLYINESGEGVHIIDNRDPENPVNKAFISIPGNVDIAVKGSILYADSYVDLVAIDISDHNNIREVGRVKDVFPYWLGTTMYDYYYPYAEIDQTKGVVIGWETKEMTRETNLEYRRYGFYNSYKYNYELLWDGGLSQNTSGSDDIGIGGSMARFAMTSDYLYLISNDSLKIFNLATPALPAQEATVGIGWDIETLFPHEDKMFIGSQTGMYIYDIANPLNPSFISNFSHFRSCDPVVVDGNYAFVTLRGGNLCGDNDNQLDVVDISNLENPVLVKEYDLNQPYGLGIDNNVLFICDGDSGLKIYNKSNVLSIDEHILAKYENINAYDVIPFNNVLMLIGNDGFYQYDYSKLDSIRLLSYIPVSSAR